MKYQLLLNCNNVHWEVCGLTLPCQSIRFNSNTQFRLPGIQATASHRLEMFLTVLHSLQLWTVYRWEFDQQPLDDMWSMAISCPKDCVPYFAYHGFFIYNIAQLDDQVIRKRIEAPMGFSAKEAGIMMTPNNTKNDCSCCKKNALQKMGVIA
jgi:hypothetical protein